MATSRDEKFWEGIRWLGFGATFLFMAFPIFWLVLTSFKVARDAYSTKIFFSPTLNNFISIFQDPYNFGPLLFNSVIVSFSTVAVAIPAATCAAYAFSRYQVKGKNDLLFFILSTRFLPAVVVTVPLFIMYTQLRLHDTHIGMILLYTVFNLSLAVWLMKGFFDEIPTEYEEAALVDGYTRMQAFFRIVLPQAVTGVAATTVFCLIFAWNEYAFALMLTSEVARTAPPSIPSMLGRGGIEWTAIAAGSLGFLIPVVIVVFLLRNYLLRGVTFGAVRK